MSECKERVQRKRMLGQARPKEKEKKQLYISSTKKKLDLRMNYFIAKPVKGN